MHDFVAHVLRRYYVQTEWNPYNSYLYLTHPSQAVLDFSIPHGLSLSISASPSPPFFTTYRLRALPTLTGALGYIFASIEDNEGNARPLNLLGSSRTIRFKELVERFRIVDSPRRPNGKDEVWQSGKRVDKRDYLLYGCMHIPSARVDALVATRLSPTWQLLATAISMPPRNPLGLPSHSGYASTYSDKNVEGGSSANAQAASTPQPAAVVGPPPGSTNLHLNLQQDTGRWFTEYSYSVDDGLIGFRFLHNLGHFELGSNGENTLRLATEDQSGRQRVDEENAVEGVAGGGLQGRFSVGAELFISPLEKSAGLSTGMRFSTLPESSLSTSAASTSLMGNPTSGLAGEDDGAPVSVSPSQPPTTITATLNPMMGHLSTAYAARMTRDIVACSRFDFNVYSYESELTLGAEYWLRSKSAYLRTSNGGEPEAEDVEEKELTPAFERRLSAREQDGLSLRDVQGKKHVTTIESKKAWSLRENEPADSAMEDVMQNALSDQRTESSLDGLAASSTGTSVVSAPVASSLMSTTLGVLKARVSSSGIAALLWEGKLRNCLVSFGIRGDLSTSDGMAGLGSSSPLRGVGIDVIYFSQNGE